MNDALMYFLKVNVAIALFYLFFRLAFYNDTFWKTRRFYLIFSILLSLVYPFISLTDWLEKQEPMQAIVVSYAQLQEMTITPQPVSKLTAENVLLAIYALVSAILLIKMIVQLVSILKWKWKGEKQELQGIEIISVKESITPFSFFNMIFINPTLHNEHDTTQILTHELTHARHMHSIDVIVSELITIACWMNPAAWLLKREIRQNLEFLADNSVLESGFDSKKYQYHLLELSYQTPDVKLGNKFNVSPLKKRITMMNQQKTSKAGILKYSLIVPLALALILSSNAQTIVNSAKKAVTATKNAVTGTKSIVASETNVVVDTKNESQESLLATIQDVKETDNSKVYTVVEKMPQFPGGDAALIKFISNNLKYPKTSYFNGVQGKVTLRFTVSEAGKVGSIEVIRSLDAACDKEALRVIKALPDFIPGEQNNKKVAVWYTLPITFKINDESADNSKVYTVVEKMPQFPGGDEELVKHIAKNLYYPAEAAKTGTQGKVIVQFVVSETGKVGNITILRTIPENKKKLDEVVVVGYGSTANVKPQTPDTNMTLLAQEAARVVSTLPDFIPGEQNGKKVAVYYTIPVMFKLN